MDARDRITDDSWKYWDWGTGPSAAKGQSAVVRKAPCAPGERADLTGCTPNRPGKQPTFHGATEAAGERVTAEAADLKATQRLLDEAGKKLGVKSTWTPNPLGAGKDLYNALPEGSAVRKVADLGLMIHHAAEKFYKGNQALAKEVAREYGLSDKKVNDLTLLLTAVDGISRWGLNWQVTDTALAALGGPVALAGAKASYYVPVGSLLATGYYLTAGAVKGKNPLKALKAARERVKAQLAKEKEHGKQTKGHKPQGKGNSHPASRRPGKGAGRQGR